MIFGEKQNSKVNRKNSGFHGFRAEDELGRTQRNFRVVNILFDAKMADICCHIFVQTHGMYTANDGRYSEL